MGTPLRELQRVTCRDAAAFMGCETVVLTSLRPRGDVTGLDAKMATLNPDGDLLSQMRRAQAVSSVQVVDPQGGRPTA